MSSPDSISDEGRDSRSLNDYDTPSSSRTQTRTEDGPAYIVTGALEHVYSSLAVLLGYAPIFTRAYQWRDSGQYEMEEGIICGFRRSAERNDELELVLYFSMSARQSVRALFQGLFESFLARHNLNVFRYEPVICSFGHMSPRTVVRERLNRGKTVAFCPECGERVALPEAVEILKFSQTGTGVVEEQRRLAIRRSRFELAIFQVMSYAIYKKLAAPECFISYASGDKEHEYWVERNLATDLQKAGIRVLLDRWEQARMGTINSSFVERVENCDRVLVVATPLYRKKIEEANKNMDDVSVAEMALLSKGLRGNRSGREEVLPLLLAGDPKMSFPPVLRSRVFADFRNKQAYYITTFDLILRLYGIGRNIPTVADIRESLQ